MDFEVDPEETEAPGGRGSPITKPVPSGSHRHRKRHHRTKSSRKDRSEECQSRSKSRHRRRRLSGETLGSPRDSRKKLRDSSPPREEERRRARPSRRPSEPRRVPRSPSGPPPSRSKWVGPIPAGGRSDDLREERRRSPKYTNKGLRKRPSRRESDKKGKAREAGSVAECLLKC